MEARPPQVSGTVQIKPEREQSLRRKHPWIFSGSVLHASPGIQDGDWVAITNTRNERLAYGHFQKGSITIRVLSFGPEAPSASFWEDRLRMAQGHRDLLGFHKSSTNAYRLIHGEGDGLPGLIIDFYNGVFVVQSHSVGMHRDRQDIATALKRHFGDSLKAIYYKSTLDQSQEEYLAGLSASPHIIEEYGNRFLVDWEQGQKTGFFLDQRENRRLLGSFAAGKRVLNTFCYSGGFSVYALNQGATLVESVDASEGAIELTRRNLELNGHSAEQHGCFAEDTFKFLELRKASHDVIVLDPPAFAKHKDARHQAVKGYQRLNTAAMKSINPNGILFTFSCSQVVDRQLFYDTIVSAAHQSGRTIRCLYHLSQPPDHPVSLFHPEGEYLKGLVLLVE